MHLVARAGMDGACKLKVLDLGVMILAEDGMKHNSNLAVQAFRRRGDTEEKRRRYDWLPWEVRAGADGTEGSAVNFSAPAHSFDVFSLGVLVLHLLIGKTEARALLDTFSNGGKMVDTNCLGIHPDLCWMMLGEPHQRPHPSEVLASMQLEPLPLEPLPLSTPLHQQSLAAPLASSGAQSSVQAPLPAPEPVPLNRDEEHCRSRSRSRSLERKQRERRQRWQTAARSSNGGKSEAHQCASPAEPVSSETRVGEPAAPTNPPPPLPPLSPAWTPPKQAEEKPPLPPPPPPPPRLPPPPPPGQPQHQQHRATRGFQQAREATDPSNVDLPTNEVDLHVQAQMPPPHAAMRPDVAKLLLAATPKPSAFTATSSWAGAGPQSCSSGGNNGMATPAAGQAPVISTLLPPMPPLPPQVQMMFGAANAQMDLNAGLWSQLGIAASQALAGTGTPTPNQWMLQQCWQQCMGNDANTGSSFAARPPAASLAHMPTPQFGTLLPQQQQPPPQLQGIPWGNLLQLPFALPPSQQAPLTGGAPFLHVPPCVQHARQAGGFMATSPRIIPGTTAIRPPRPSDLGALLAAPHSI